MIKPLLMIAAALSGCTTTSFKDAESQFERTSYFTFTNLNEMTITITDSHGNTRALNLSGSSDQVQALEKVAEGVAKGITAAAKP